MHARVRYIGSMTAQIIENDWPNCVCGCGYPAMAAEKNDARRGLVAGQPRKYASLQCKYPKRPELVGEPRVCSICGVLTALHDMVRNKTANEGHGTFCRHCEQVKRKARRAAVRPNPYREHNKKLPAYEVLKDLYLGGDGKKPMTYGQIAAKYNVHVGTVRSTLKARAERRGEWPLLTPAQNEKRRLARIQETKVSLSPVGLAYVVEEYMNLHDLTKREFAEKMGFDPRYIYRLMRHGIKVSAHMAVRLLEACGEPVRPDIRAAAKQYKPAKMKLSAV